MNISSEFEGLAPIDPYAGGRAAKGALGCNWSRQITEVDDQITPTLFKVEFEGGAEWVRRDASGLWVSRVDGSQVFPFCDVGDPVTLWHIDDPSQMRGGVILAVVNAETIMVEFDDAEVVKFTKRAKPSNPSVFWVQQGKTMTHPWSLDIGRRESKVRR